MRTIMYESLEFLKRLTELVEPPAPAHHSITHDGDRLVVSIFFESADQERLVQPIYVDGEDLEKDPIMLAKELFGLFMEQWPDARPVR